MSTTILEGKRAGTHLFDTDGRKYIDGDSSAGIFNLGRRHPELAEELKRAMRATDQGNFPIISEEKALLAEALAKFVPGALECSLFGVTRGEAVDAACKVVRGFTKRPGLVTVDGGWYGQTGFALSLSQRDDKHLFEPLVPGVSVVPFGDFDAASRAIGKDTAAVFLEPIQAENGCRTVDEEYARKLESLCKARGALLVVDETQTNFGRTGAPFSFELFHIEPDVLILGEALGGGMFPITVTMMTQRVNEFMNDHPMIHLSTFGGSDVGCCVGRKALEIYTREAPWKNAKTMGDRLRAAFDALAGEYPSLLPGVEGAGLLLALKTPSADMAKRLCKACLQHGLLLASGKVAKDTVVVRPSLLISGGEADELAAVLGMALRDCAADA